MSELSLTDPRRGERYAVLCGGRPEDDCCDCPGATYRPGSRCRHMEAVREMVESGLLP